MERSGAFLGTAELLLLSEAFLAGLSVLLLFFLAAGSFFFEAELGLFLAFSLEDFSAFLSGFSAFLSGFSAFLSGLSSLSDLALSSAGSGLSSSTQREEIERRADSL